MELNSEELAILNDTRFLKIKQEVSEKVISYFSQIERALHQDVIQLENFPFPEGTFLKGGKISKGEQYKLLPYFILDYPRLFTQKEIFGYRTMLWWGHHLSCTLHLSGPILQQNKNSLVEKIIQDKEVYFCVNDQPWDYYYEDDNFRKVKNLSKEDLHFQIQQNGFIKVSNYLPIEEWNEYKSFTLKTFARFLQYFY